MAGPSVRILLASEHTEFDAAPRPWHWPWRSAAGCRLHAVLPILSNPEFEMAAPQLAERADEQAAHSRQALQGLGRCRRGGAATAVRRGAEPFAEIVQAAHELPTDLIVLRRRGKRSFWPTCWSARWSARC
jgi:nucleotide-binding universal stress UspA family protein